MASFVTTNASLRVPRALSSMLKMSLLMLASTALFQRSTAVCFGANTDQHDETNARRQLLLRGSSPSFDDRLLFDPRAPFDFYNDACEAECQGNEDLALFDNVCPKCPEKYESQHCNHCCFDGASSLRLRWHGCPGDVTFASVDQGVQDCQLEPDDRSPTDGIRFISCSCYETINTPETFDPSACQPLSTTVALTSDYGFDSDICIVSVDELDNGDATINLSKPLPAVIGLVHSPLDDQDEDYTSQYWNPYPFRTYFDTTCNIIDEDNAPYVLPLFPGYGKIPSSCPEIGFIDLDQADTPSLPLGIDHWNGEPATEPFWYEFIDGTSVGFWPTNDDDEHHFDPTFAICACNDCDGTPPTSPSAPGPGGPPTPAPVVDPTSAPQSPPTVAPVADPTIAPVADPTSAPQNPPTVAPVVDPTSAPVVDPTSAPQSPPTIAPVADPTSAPVVDPTSAPQSPPTVAPVADPTLAPQSPPTVAPVADPTSAPVADPTSAPQSPPTVAPVADPTAAPVTQAPQDSPVLSPVFSPVAAPTTAPVADPTSAPVVDPTTAPVTPAPQDSPVASPAAAPTTAPVADPTSAPVVDPTAAPVTPAPQDSPVASPAAAPVAAPTTAPVADPTSAPVVDPTAAPVTPAPQDSPVASPVASPIEPTIPGNPGPPGPSTPAPVSDPTASPTEHECPPTSIPTATSNPGPGGPSEPSPTPAPVVNPTSSPVEPTSVPVDPTSAPVADPTPAPVVPTSSPTPSNGCEIIDYSSCAVFAATKCAFNGQGGTSIGDTCVFQDSEGRRKLNALKKLVDSSDSLDSIPSKQWIMAQKDYHVTSLSALMFE